MKILQVNNVYGEKSTGKITRDIHVRLLDAGFEALAVYGRGRQTNEKGVIRLCPDWYGKLNSLRAKLTGLPYGGCLLSTWRLQRIILREKPDVVHLQCLNGNFVNIYRLIGWLKKRRIKTVVSLHAEFMHTANCGYAFDCEQWKRGCQKCPELKRSTGSFLFDRTAASWKKMKRAFEGFEKDCLIAPVSPWTQERARQSDILKDFSFQTVLNGIDTRQTFHLREESPREKNRVFHATACFSPEPEHIKGGWYILELAKRLPRVHFVVAGNHAPGLEVPANVELLGRVTDQSALAEQYRRAALTVLVSKKETFSMPCAESLCCGTPVVGFKAGAPEQIALPQYSAFTDHGDLDALEKTVCRWLEREDLDHCRIAADGERAYSAESMAKAFMEVYRRLYGNEAT